MDDIKISKKLSFILRHGAEKLGIEMKSDGYVLVSDILKHKSHSLWSEEDIQRVVKNNEKQRFALRYNDNGDLEIRANQGHSVDVPELQLEEIIDPSLYPTLIHGTNFRAWDLIKTEGLKTMNRTHIHLTTGLPGDGEVISGMRKSCTVFIYIDMSKAIKDNIKFFKAANGVILTKGLNESGVLSLRYFSQVLNAKTKQPLIWFFNAAFIDACDN